jgi:aryl-alcohol dehydrogenase (NADP+)
MMFGGDADEETSRAIIDRAFERGVNFIDTANVYNGGRSEEVLGRAIGARRDAFVIATKFGFPGRPSPGPNDFGQSRKHIFQAVEQSLQRLGTDYIDLVYFHRALPGVQLEEGIRALGDLIRQGKIRYWGVSNFQGWRIAAAAKIALEMGVDLPVASQPLYNIVARTAEVEQLPSAHHFGIGNVTYSPLARGVLTGKYIPGAQPDQDSRAGRGDVRLAQTEWRPESISIAQAIAARAAARGGSSIAFAVAWVLRNQLVSAAVAGPRTLAQWDSYAASLDFELDAEDEAFIDGLVSPGHASTPGYTDPAFPVEGRVM